MDSVFGPIFDVIGFLLSGFYSLIPNFGVAIILLTILIMLLLYPLTAKQTKSMMAMQRVQPEIKKLQAKYKGDRQKLNEEMMKFYQENKINPLAGCLPILAQMPVFISLYSVLRSPFKYVPRSSDLFGALCHGFPLHYEGASGKPRVLACGDVLASIHTKISGVPKGLIKGDNLLHHLQFLGMDLQKSAAGGKHDGFIDAAPYFIVVVLGVVASYVQLQRSQKRTPAANKQMGMVMKIFPALFALIAINVPSGLAVYFLVSGIFRLVQQEVIFNRHGSVAHGPGGKPLEAKSSVRPSKAPPPPEALEASSEPEPQSSAQRTADRAPVQTGARASGLRGMFSMPPPAEGNGSPSPTGTGGSTPTSSATGNRSSASRRRNKKKRKR